MRMPSSGSVGGVDADVVTLTAAASSATVIVSAITGWPPPMQSRSQALPTEKSYLSCHHSSVTGPAMEYFSKRVVSIPAEPPLVVAVPVV